MLVLSVEDYRLIHRPVKILKLVFAAVAALLYVIKFVSDVLQDSGFLQALLFSSTNKIVMIETSLKMRFPKLNIHKSWSFILLVFFQAHMGNMDRTSEKWKMIGGNLALVQVSKMIHIGAGVSAASSYASG